MKQDVARASGLKGIGVLKISRKGERPMKSHPTKRVRYLIETNLTNTEEVDLVNISFTCSCMNEILEEGLVLLVTKL
ncbi:hypothetical protein TNCV_4229001 [Trichonephila clavipes]|nr:hypothetical protein TNCV_4229001 [Trichonephila clavipes]